CLQRVYNVGAGAVAVKAARWCPLRGARRASGQSASRLGSAERRGQPRVELVEVSWRPAKLRAKPRRACPGLVQVPSSSRGEHRLAAVASEVAMARVRKAAARKRGAAVASEVALARVRKAAARTRGAAVAPEVALARVPRVANRARRDPAA